MSPAPMEDRIMIDPKTFDRKVRLICQHGQVIRHRVVTFVNSPLPLALWTAESNRGQHGATYAYPVTPDMASDSALERVSVTIS